MKNSLKIRADQRETASGGKQISHHFNYCPGVRGPWVPRGDVGISWPKRPLKFLLILRLYNLDEIFLISESYPTAMTSLQINGEDLLKT